MRLHRRMCHFIGKISIFEYVRRFAKSLIRVAKDVVIILLNVVRLLRMNEVGSGLHRLFRIEIRRQWLIFGVDELESALGNRLRLGDDTSHVVADVTDFVHGKRGFIVPDRKNSVLVGSVMARHDCDYAVDSQRASRVNALDDCMRIRRV